MCDGYPNLAKAYSDRFRQLENLVAIGGVSEGKWKGQPVMMECACSVNERIFTTILQVSPSKKRLLAHLVRQSNAHIVRSMTQFALILTKLIAWESRKTIKNHYLCNSRVGS
jgi:hypothetical protein